MCKISAIILAPFLLGKKIEDFPPQGDFKRQGDKVKKLNFQRKAIRTSKFLDKVCS